MPRMINDNKKKGPGIGKYNIAKDIISQEIKIKKKYFYIKNNNNFDKKRIVS